ncbi:MAG: retropepsin-like domain-containing protein [Acidobacteriia bacterium]|nr:retropepsin-like domain-containing protein [Terriglobia bacterium]
MRNWTAFMAGCVSFLLVAFASRADPPPGEIPFELCPGYTIVAEGEIGSLKGLRFLIDTGAMPSVLDERIAHQLHLSGKAQSVTVFSRKIKGQGVVLPSLKFGPIQVVSLPILVRDLTFLEGKERWAIGLTPCWGWTFSGHVPSSSISRPAASFSLLNPRRTLRVSPTPPCGSWSWGPRFRAVLFACWSTRGRAG